MVGVNRAINEVMNKLSLLEEHQYRLKEEEFTKTWISFSRPLDIFQAKVYAKNRLDKADKHFYEALREMIETLAEELANLKVEFEIL